MPEGVHYVRNANGDIHSVDEEHFIERLHIRTRSGNLRMDPDFQEISEAEARAGNPQLFGAPDPEVIKGMTPAEMQAFRDQARFRDDVAAEIAAAQKGS